MTLLPRKVLLQLAFPVAAIVVGMSVVRARGYALDDDLRLVAPSILQLVLWTAIWIAWMAVSEMITHRLGLPEPKRWESTATWVIVLRVIMLVILAPIAEEFIFRGLLLYRLSITDLGTPGAILIAAAIFAVVHLQYRREQIAIVFLDGVVLGIALVVSDSLIVPIVLHVIGNLYAVYQRLPASVGARSSM